MIKMLWDWRLRIWRHRLSGNWINSRNRLYLRLTLKNSRPSSESTLQLKFLNAKVKEVSGKELDCLELSDASIHLLMEERFVLLLTHAKETVSSQAQTAMENLVYAKKTIILLDVFLQSKILKKSQRFYAGIEINDSKYNNLENS